MKKQVLSFVRCPLGYFINFVVTLLDSVGAPNWMHGCSLVIWCCENLCAKDGVQDDWCVLVPVFKKKRG